MQKRPVCSQRIRKIPGQFSWVDHRLVRDRYIESCTHAAAALYLFLVTVADAQGLSYYADRSVMARLSMDAPTLESARRNLIQAGLIAYQKPLYQVLSLEPVAQEPPSVRTPLDRPVSVGQILKQLMGDSS